jgi:DNA polymerase-3 subunit delta
VVAEQQAKAIGPLLQRLAAQGVQPVTLCISTLRHFRALHAAASDPGGPGTGLSRLRPPVFGPRRDRMQRQAERWGMLRLEQALELLVDTDLTLRSSSSAPAMPVMERTLVRLTSIVR